MADDGRLGCETGVPGSVSITDLLRDWSQGDDTALEKVAPLVQPELLRISRRQMHRERQAHTLECEGLVHEAFVQLLRQGRVQWQSRAHFYGVAAKVMRRVLVDYARRRLALKRGGPATLLVSDQMAEHAQESGVLDQVDVLAVHEALAALEALDARQSRIVEMRYFAGLTLEETADALELSTATVKREWRSARAFLLRELQDRP